MSNGMANTPPKRKGSSLWLVLWVVLLAGGGAAYFLQQNPEWSEKLTEKLAALQKPGEVQPQPAQAPAPARQAPSFDAVSAEGGMLVAAGKAEPSATVLLLNGGQTLGEAKADENGEWLITLEQPLPAGPYNLSLLAVDPKTQARVPGRRGYALTVAPQERKAPAQTVAATGAQPGAKPASASVSTSAPAAQQQPNKPAPVAAVKPGDTLWGIAEQYYGKGAGARYGEIAGANKDRIKNPNLIFPQQQFEIPGK